jgi:hypothetical protein
MIMLVVKNFAPNANNLKESAALIDCGYSVWLKMMIKMPPRFKCKFQKINFKSPLASRLIYSRLSRDLPA